MAKAAEELARSAAREALGPLLDAACTRLGAVVKRAFDIAAEQAQLQRGAGGRSAGLPWLYYGQCVLMTAWLNKLPIQSWAVHLLTNGVPCWGHIGLLTRCIGAHQLLLCRL